MLQMAKPKQKMKRAGRKPRAGSRRKPLPPTRRKPTRVHKAPPARESPPATAAAPEPRQTATARETPVAQTITTRALKANLKACLDRVRAGESLIIVDRGKPIAFMVPVPPRPQTAEEVHAALERMAAKGLVTVGRGRPLSKYQPVRIQGSDTLTSEMVIEDRKDRF